MHHTTTFQLALTRPFPITPLPSTRRGPTTPIGRRAPTPGPDGGTAYHPPIGRRGATRRLGVTTRQSNQTGRWRYPTYRPPSMVRAPTPLSPPSSPRRLAVTRLGGTGIRRHRCHTYRATKLRRTAGRMPILLSTDGGLSLLRPRATRRISLSLQVATRAGHSLAGGQRAEPRPGTRYLPRSHHHHFRSSPPPPRTHLTRVSRHGCPKHSSSLTDSASP